MEYQEILDFAYSLAEKLVTETDQAVEEMIKSAIAAKYPSHKFPSVACSIGVAHKSQPVVGVIALPFFHQIAGAIIIHETGGFFSGGKGTLDRPIGDILMSRRYIFAESTVQIQRRLVKELYDVVEEWTNEDM
ncbi:hypothetical protein CI109_104769 [Kwoniella shandongensis]|uniref:Uncharacterized protein n=1 Tax=Kwoniella shandongensis TaxID=1734106 RepID=A0AAJ8LJ67_9TREE